MSRRNWPARLAIRRTIACTVVASGAALAMVVVLAGCAPAAPGHPLSSSSSASPMASPTAGPVSAPARVFGGDCNSVLSTSTVNGIAGVALPPTDYSVQGDLKPGHLTTKLRGGVECVWQVPGGGSYLEVVALSANGASPTAPDSSSCSVGGSACAASLTVDGYWLAWIWDVGVISAIDGVKLNEFGAAMRSSVNSAGPAPQFVQPVGSWQKSVDCSALASASGLLAKLGGSGWTLGAAGEDQKPLAPLAPESNNGEYTACLWSSHSSASGPPDGQVPAFRMHVLPGSAWYASHVEAIPGATTITIPGVARAIRVPDPDQCSNEDPIPSPCDDFTINVFDGVNWLQVNTDADEFARDTSVIARLVSALNES